jgi:hypothetical protein
VDIGSTVRVQHHKIIGTDKVLQDMDRLDRRCGIQRVRDGSPKGLSLSILRPARHESPFCLSSCKSRE